jgi:hypothetical protein
LQTCVSLGLKGEEERTALDRAAWRDMVMDLCLSGLKVKKKNNDNGPGKHHRTLTAAPPDRYSSQRRDFFPCPSLCYE